MIKVKGFNESRQETKPSREDYVLDEKEKGRIVPLALLLFLTGFVVYLKSFFSSSPEAAPGQHAARRQEDDGSQGGPPEDANDFGPDSEDDVTGSIGRDKGSSDNVFPIPSMFNVSPQAIGNFMASDSPPIDFTGPRHGPFPRIETGFLSDQSPASNDNQTAGRPSSGSGSGGAVGGGGDSSDGGGGSSSGPGTPPTNPPDGSDPDPPRNRAPRVSGAVYLKDVVGCHAYLISVLALLAGATDPDGDPLALANLSTSSGTITAAPDGGWMFTPDHGMLGAVTLTFSISDGTESVQQVAYFSVVEAAPIVGTACADILLGTMCADLIDGGDGDDNIDARGGNDLIMGGDGDDHIIGGAGDDVIYAGCGNDIVFAGSGNDIVFGGSGNDRLFGDDGNDTLYGEDGNDLIMGGAGQDVLFGQAGDDVVHGGDGDDVISDGKGKDVVHGGDGNDTVIAAADAESDSYRGDAGDDTLDYSSATLSIVIDLGHGTAEGFEIGRDLISGFEEIISGLGDDRIVAGSTSISMTGGDGNDTFEFHISDDDHQPDLVRKITDFTIGDRIIAARFEVRYRDEDIEDELEGLFEDIYLSNDGEYRPVRFRFEQLDNEDRTFVDVREREDSDDVYSIELYGHHRLEVTVGVS